MTKPISIPFPKTQATPSPQELQQQIRMRAYFLYEQRGREDGHDLDDWLKAEAEVTPTKAKVMVA